MLTMFRRLPGMSLCLVVLAALVIDIQAAEIPAYEWQPITMTESWAARDVGGQPQIRCLDKGLVWLQPLPMSELLHKNRLNPLRIR